MPKRKQPLDITSGLVSLENVIAQYDTCRGETTFSLKDIILKSFVSEDCIDNNFIKRIIEPNKENNVELFKAYCHEKDIDINRIPIITPELLTAIGCYDKHMYREQLRGTLANDFRIDC